MASKRTGRAAVFSLMTALVVGISAAIVPATPAAAAATLSGVVTSGSSTGARVAGATVEVYSIHGDELTLVEETTTTSAASGANYTMTLPTGTYRVYITPPPASGLAAGWAKSNAVAVPFEFDGTKFYLNTTAVTINTSLAAGGSITGTKPSTDWNASAYLWNPKTSTFERTKFTGSGPTNYTIPSLPVGEYLVRFSPVNGTVGATTIYTAAEYWKSRTSVWDSRSVTVTAGTTTSGISLTATTADVRTVARAAGQDRWITSARMSAIAFPTANTVFIVNGENFPDALAAGPAASALGAPVLLTHPLDIQPSVELELQRLKPTQVVIVGGTGSVSTAVETEIANLLNPLVTGLKITRIAGADRFDGSRQLARFAFSGYAPKVAYLVTGLDFPDGLAAGSSAAIENAPLILDNGTGVLAPETLTLLNDLGVQQVVIVGGTGSIPATTESALRSASFETVRRNGADRFITSTLAAKGAFAVADTVVLSTGLAFPDALSGTAFAAALDAPMYLVQSTCVPASVVTELARLKPQRIYLLGSNNTLSLGVENITQCP
jgi:putative cell wall-binding protein